MSETDAIENRVSLSDRDVWIIDDDIPIGLLEPRDESMVTGDRPIDRGTLRALLRLASWRDQELQELCKELVDEAGCVTAFTYPGPAILHLEKGAPIPDVVIFDWQYLGVSRVDVQNLLERMLRQCLSLIQVYTTLDTQEIAEALNPLRKRHGARLEQPRRKVETHARQLVQALDSKLEKSLSTRLAGGTRRSSLAAIEEVLVRIDDLPLNRAIDMLAGKDVPKESELVGLLSVKMSEALESSPDVARVVEDWAKAKGIPENEVSRCVREVVDLLAANVRRHIQRDDSLMKEVRSTWEALDSSGGSEYQEPDKTVQEFFAFRLYHRPGDDLVRTGDIVLWQQTDELDDPPSELHFVVTPPCDLERFWKKTRGCLTLARMYAIDSEAGTERMRLYQGGRFQLSGSITATHPMVMPSVALTGDNCADYALFAYEFLSINLAKKEGKANESPLTYTDLADLGMRMKRLCAVSEPFLAGVLEKLSATLFAAGVPDYPKDERTRLENSHECIDRR